MKSQKLLILPLLLMGCSQNTANSQTWINQHPSYPLYKQVVLNVEYVLEPNCVAIYKNFENKDYVWRYAYSQFSQILTEYIYREKIPENYSLSTEADYYSCQNIFYNYGNECVVVERK